MLKELINLESGKEKMIIDFFTLYHDISDALFTLKKYRMIKYLVHSFSELFKLMVEKKHYDVLDRTGGALETIGVYAVNLEIRDVIHLSVHSLYTLGIASAKNKLVWNTPQGAINIAERTIDHLLKIEGETLKYRSKSKEFDTIINEIEYARMDIEKNLEKETDFSDLWH